MPHGRRGLALYAPAPRGKLVVVAASPEAAARGIAPGMPLAEAKALGGPVDLQPHDPDADREAMRRLALACQQFGPYVALEETSFSRGSKNRADPAPRKGPECLFVDITGCGPVFQGEDRLAQEASRELRRRGYTPRIAIADTPGAAWAFAHFGVSSPLSLRLQEPQSFRNENGGRGAGAPSPQPSPPPGLFTGASKPTPGGGEGAGIIIPPGDHPAALQPLPVEALRLPEETVELLHALDLRRIGQLLDLPRAELPARFGLEVLQRLDQALGRRAEPLNPEKPPEPLEASWNFDDPTGDRRAIDVVLEHLLEHILEKLRPRQLGVQRLACSFKLIDGQTVQFQVGLLHASASSRHLLELIRLQEERLHLPAEVAMATLRAPQALPLEFQQGQIYADDARRRGEHFPALLERLSNRLGEHAVLHPRLQPDAQPEYACRYEPWLRRGIGFQPARDMGAERRVNVTRRNDARPLRPPYLKSRPVAVAAMSVIPDGPPLRFTWKNQDHLVARWWGPERIETGWWRGNDVRRDYYLVETAAGAQFWMFRNLDRQTWFVHGSL